MALSYRRGMELVLYDESLFAWRESVEALEQSEGLLSWALRVIRATVKLSTPFWMIATLISVGLSPLLQPTRGLAFLPLHWLVLTPLLGIVLLTSDLWTRMPPARPLLLFVGCFSVASAMVMISLIPDDPGVRRAKHILCELWPFSQRRLQWIAEHGTGK